jgi:hypothetical protein
MAVRDVLDRAVFGRVVARVEADGGGCAVVEVGGDGIGERERGHGIHRAVEVVELGPVAVSSAGIRRVRYTR